MNQRSHNIEKATNHIKKMLSLYDNEINESIQQSVVFRQLPEHTQQSGCEAVIVENMTTTEAIFKYADTDKITCALNFASFKYPGGGFITGNMAQEESLCHDSTLYAVIGSDKFKAEYEYNRKHTNNGLYEHMAIYSPDIIFDFPNESVYCDIITCAAPNYEAAKKNNVSKEENDNAMRERIELILRLAEEHNVDILILGAWGCGVFGQNPISVAEMFSDALKKYKFGKVIFAITNDAMASLFENTFTIKNCEAEQVRQTFIVKV